MTTDPTPPVPYEIVDRDYETPCWNHLNTKTPGKVLMWWGAVIGFRPNDRVFMHLCERHGEVNRCIRPSHIKIATQSENRRHALELAAEAGNVHPWYGHSGRRRSDATKAKISAAGRGRRHSEETRAKMSAAHKKRGLTPEQLAKMQEGRRGKPLRQWLCCLCWQSVSVTNASRHVCPRPKRPRKPWSPEAIERRAAKMRGRSVDQATRDKIRATLTGTTRTIRRVRCDDCGVDVPANWLSRHVC